MWWKLKNTFTKKRLTRPKIIDIASKRKRMGKHDAEAKHDL